MNKKQRLVLAIFVPFIILFIALVIANSVGYTVIYRPTILSGDVFDKYKEPITYYREGNPFDWERTWYIWLFFIVFVCIFEYKLFADKKIIIDKKKKNNLI